MATPTAKQSQAVATPPVSTPFSFSGHRPTASPAQVFKKSPAGSNMQYVPPYAGYDSPSASMALGMDGLNIPGMNMNLGIAGLGEDEKKRRLEAVVEILKMNKGRLSEPGIERLATRLGLESLWEDSHGAGAITRTLVLAGSAFSLDVDFANNMAKRVLLDIPNTSDIVTRHGEKAGGILLRDLEFGPGQSPLTKMLDRFADNLERLAQLDRLSVLPGLNCHEAIAGIYASLEKLHLWEVDRLKEQDDMAGKEQSLLERAAMCTKSGQPQMHSRDRLGMSLNYWQEKRRIKNVKEENKVKIWSLLIECAPIPLPELDFGAQEVVYPTIRSSEHWISPDIKKKEMNPDDFMEMIPTHDMLLDWLEPEPTLLPSEDITTTKFPEVMLVAKFDPPLITLFSLAMNIHQSIGIPIDNPAAFFDDLLFPRAPEEKREVGDTRKIKHQKVIKIFSADGKSSSKAHKNTVYFEKVEFGHTLTELPFSHPRQIVAMLPQLRQYAFLSTILRNSFSTTPISTSPGTDADSMTEKSKEEIYADIFSSSTAPPSNVIGIDATFTMGQYPRLQASFPLDRRMAEVVFDIKSNGVVEVVNESVTTLKPNCGLSKEDMGRMLEITEDLGVWIEFIKGRLD
ncbi:mediator of RNA polymerase II transcription subunit 1-domain-containing protein [Calycina marina]|uniref:Mediator of RNA polymerase II transcription subunit 1 n=1 Tax=Calycina marina TaxID=1763456 RepID=A0A9P7YZL5_9HELO|nr:mediator of RNA polymerase II transcription subunit 1-domain-containing protein [Calycina marina]